MKSMVHVNAFSALPGYSVALIEREIDPVDPNAAIGEAVADAIKAAHNAGVNTDYNTFRLVLQFSKE
jgi:hypothetical protein